MGRSNSEAPASADVDAMSEGQFLAEPATRFKGESELMLAIGKDRLELRIAFEAFRHVAHCRAHGLVAADVARLILAQAGLVELLPALHEAVGAAARIGAEFGFELERADGTVDPAAGGLGG